MVEIATNPQGYRVHASEELMLYATDKNEPTLARYHIWGHNFNLDISHSYGSVIGNVADIVYNVFELINTVVWLHHRCYVPDNHYNADVD
jgi:hypothetical protein